MRGHGCKFHRLLLQAVLARLEEPTFARAAARVGIARSTLFIWVKESEFQALLAKIRHARYLEAARQFLEQKQAEAKQHVITMAVGRNPDAGFSAA